MRDLSIDIIAERYKEGLREFYNNKKASFSRFYHGPCILFHYDTIKLLRDFQPDVKGYAATLSPLAVTNDGAHLWQIGPYITWYQSPFVHFRLEYNHQDGEHMGPAEKKIILQCIFAAGPHKHERY